MNNPTNTIEITQCDNQLIIYAVSSDENTLYKLAQIGAGFPVNASVSLVKGTYVEPKPISNPTSPSSSTVCLPADTYTIYYTGFNAGGPYNFAFTLNSNTYQLKNDPNKPLYGFVWNHGGPAPSDIIVTID